MVAEPEGIVVGTVDEDFAVESMRGDIMLLGNTSWRIRRVEAQGGPRAGGRCARRAAQRSVLARRSSGAHAELSEQVARTCGKKSAIAAAYVSRWESAQTQPDVAAAVSWLKDECGLDDSGAEQADRICVAGRAVLGAVPTQTTIIAERFFDEGGGMQLVIHAPFGGRINKAWGLALRKRFCRRIQF